MYMVYMDYRRNPNWGPTLESNPASLDLVSPRDIGSCVVRRFIAIFLFVVAHRKPNHNSTGSKVSRLSQA